jgi:hypothetical protein
MQSLGSTRFPAHLETLGCNRNNVTETLTESAPPWQHWLGQSNAGDFS